MTDLIRLVGITEATPNAASKEIRFVLATSDGEPILCVGEYGAIASIISGLATSIDVLQMALSRRGAVVTAPTIPIRQIQIKKHLLSDDVVVRVTSVQGVPYIFQVPAQAAIQIAEQLKNEVSREVPKGTA